MSNVRLSALETEVLVVSTTPSKVRLSALEVEVLVVEITWTGEENHTEDLDTWDSTVDASFPELYTIETEDANNLTDTIVSEFEYSMDLSDDANLLSDTVGTDYYIAVWPLEVNSEEWLSKIYKNPVKWHDAWNDGIETTTTPWTDLEIQLDTLIHFNDDDIELDVGLELTEDADNWTDEVYAMSAFIALAYDTLFYTLTDTIEVLLEAHLVQDIADTLNFWTDSTTTELYAAKIFTEALVISDNLSLVLHTLINGEELLALTDALGGELPYTYDFSDILTITDTLETFGEAQLIQDVNDDMGNFTDGIDPDLFGTDLSYLRRYLNDVIR